MTTSDAQSERELLELAARLVIGEQFGAPSFVQRKLRLWYARAARLMDELEELGVVGPAEGSMARTVLVPVEGLDAVVDKIRGVA